MPSVVDKTRTDIGIREYVRGSIKGKYLRPSKAKKTGYKARTGNSRGVQKSHKKMAQAARTHNTKTRLYEALRGRYIGWN